ncbi:MAG: ATP-grasp domain-containing protein [Acetatifactor sp.]|nr:ATP-grasp domain-containing protein [Acetatifactor sp.]
MLYKMDELLLLELLTYLPDKFPFVSVLGADDRTVREYVYGIDVAKIEDDVVYNSCMNGFDWKNIIMAWEKKPNILDAYIIEPHLDTAYGGGGGISAVFINEKTKEAVVAFRGTASNEWVDDFVGANQVDSLQQINAMEWYKSVYEKLHLEDYTVTIIGHSKGGNKAKYITILNETPARCVSFDGQGFSDEFIEHYKKKIIRRQGIIENHNIDFDYVNILMNDVGKRTYYVGYDYGKFGFAESHSPNTFFDFGENGEYKMRVNPNGQRPEMQIMDQFINSMIRSGVSAKEQAETNRLVGILVEKAFAIGKENTVTEYINLLCDLVGDPTYSDNTAYLLAFVIKYSRQNTDFLKALKDIMLNFKMEGAVKVIDMFDDLVTSKKLNAIIDLSNFLIMHVNGIVVKQVQNVCKKKYGIELTADQVRGVLQIVGMTKEMLKTLELEMDGSDVVVEDVDGGEESKYELPANMNVVVLAGGLSNERNLSLKSGYVVSKVLAEKGHNVILLDAYMGYDEQEMIIPNAFEDPVKYSLEPQDIPDDIPDLWAVRKRRKDQSGAYFGPNVLQICRQADLVFIALHGASGENGKVQATFDLLGIQYTGCDYFSSAVSSNKSVAKQLLEEAGIPVPKGFCAFKNEEIGDPEEFGLSYPVIVKPNNGGIGLGISVANDKNSYLKALKEAFRWEGEIIVEEYVAGREFAVGSVAGKAFPVIEVLPLETRNKEVGMTLRGVELQKCPADIPEELAAKLRETAEKVSSVLGVLAYSKVDFIVREDGSFVCLECDSLPQLYQDAHLVLEAKAAGISFGDLCDKIMELSLRKK